MPSDAGTLAAALAPPPVRLARPALFLDLDGVLAPIESRPGDVGPVSTRTALLRDLLERLDGRVAVVSGRQISEIDRILEDAIPHVAGVHGLERRNGAGTVARGAPPPGLADAVAEMHLFAIDHPGVIVEDKGVAVGMHYRLAPKSEAAVIALGETLARRFDLTPQPGKKVMELKARGADKGSALTAYMVDRPFKGGVPIMVGDDLTDEMGFIAARRLGGFGILVGPQRETAARFRLENTDAVADWLSALEPA